jgi:hypothetical protein
LTRLRVLISLASESHPTIVQDQGGTL